MGQSERSGALVVPLVDDVAPDVCGQLWPVDDPLPDGAVVDVEGWVVEVPVAALAMAVPSPKVRPREPAARP